jgi:succinoglycan biosynthesis protein ExoM
MTRVTITIASAGRPTLRRTLSSLDRMRLPPGVSADVVVADDSREGRAAALVDAGRPWRLPVVVIAVGAGNVALARNAALGAATGDLLAMVDDDEWVAEDWLERMMAALAEFEADAVFGPVRPRYPEGTPDWFVRADPLYVEWGRRGTRVSVGRSGNTLIRRSIIERSGLAFDAALGRTGGEDTVFFHALHRAGARLVVTDDAIIEEDVPAGRASVAYVRRRSLRKGQIYARFVAASVTPAPMGRAAFYAAAAAKAAGGFALAALTVPFDRATALRLAVRAWMNQGKIYELLGLTPGEMS